jgi:predicted small integral membrane protein
VRNGLEMVFGGDLFLDLLGKTFINLDHLGTFGADEMMMMAVVIFPD